MMLMFTKFYLNFETKIEDTCISSALFLANLKQNTSYYTEHYTLIQEKPPGHQP